MLPWYHQDNVLTGFEQPNRSAHSAVEILTVLGLLADTGLFWLPLENAVGQSQQTELS